MGFQFCETIVSRSLLYVSGSSKRPIVPSSAPIDLRRSFIMEVGGEVVDNEFTTSTIQEYSLASKSWLPDLKSATVCGQTARESSRWM